MGDEALKAAGAVRQKIRQVAYRHLKRKLAEDLKERPSNCTFNHKIQFSPLDLHQFCIHPEVENRVCEDWEPSERASQCPYFKHQVGKEQIKADFKRFLETATLAEIAAEYPDLAALMWVLQTERLADMSLEEPPPEVETPAPLPPAPVVMGIPDSFPIPIRDRVIVYARNFPDQDLALQVLSQHLVPQIVVEAHNPFPSWSEWLLWPFRPLFGKRRPTPHE